MSWKAVLFKCLHALGTGTNAELLSNPVLSASRAWHACMTSPVSKLIVCSSGAQVIQYKQLVGNERDASVQQDIDQAIDTLVQQLRLQVCTFQSSVCSLKFKL